MSVLGSKLNNLTISVTFAEEGSSAEQWTDALPTFRTDESALISHDNLDYTHFGLAKLFGILGDINQSPFAFDPVKHRLGYQHSNGSITPIKYEGNWRAALQDCVRNELPTASFLITRVTAAEGPLLPSSQNAPDPDSDIEIVAVKTKRRHTDSNATSRVPSADLPPKKLKNNANSPIAQATSNNASIKKDSSQRTEEAMSSHSSGSPTNNEVESDTNIPVAQGIFQRSNGDMFDDVRNTPSFLHLNSKDWNEMCVFFKHDPNHHSTRLGHVVKCPGIAPHRMPRIYQAYGVFWMLKQRTHDVLGGLLADGVGVGKTMLCLLYCWTQFQLIEAGNDMLRCQESEDADLRRRHLPPSTKAMLQASGATCPSQEEWHIQCPCVSGSLSSQIFRQITNGPALIAVPPKLIPQWKQEFDATFSSPDNKLKLFIEHHNCPGDAFTDTQLEALRRMVSSPTSKCNAAQFIVLTAANVNLDRKIRPRFRPLAPHSIWSSMFWDESHEIRGINSGPSIFFKKEMEVQAIDIGRYPMLWGMTASPVVRGIEDILNIVTAIEDVTWRENKYVKISTTVEIEGLGKRYKELLRARDKHNVSNNDGTTAPLPTELIERQQSYARDLSAILHPLMLSRRPSDKFLGEVLVDLPKLHISHIPVVTDRKYVPDIQRLAELARKEDDDAHSKRLALWRSSGSRGPQPEPTTNKLSQTFRQLQFCANFPAYASILREKKISMSLNIDLINKYNLYSSSDAIDQTWYGRYFKELSSSSLKLKMLDKFLDQINMRIQADKHGEPHKLIIGCTSPPTVVMLSRWFKDQRSDFPVVTLHPGISMIERNALIRSFDGVRCGGTDDQPTYENQEAGRSRVLVASMTLLSTGYNISRASNVCIFDLPWTPDKSEQTIGRAYRSGQTREVFVKVLWSSGNGIERSLYSAMNLHHEVKSFSYDITTGEQEKILKMKRAVSGAEI